MSSRISESAERRDFEKAQLDESFVGWLALREAEFEIGHGFDPDFDFSELSFSRDGLQIAEKWALKLWGESSSSAYGPESEADKKLQRAQITYFIGETFVRAYGGKWIFAVDGSRRGWSQQVQLPFMSLYLDPNTQLIIALDRRTGHEWTRVFDNLSEYHAKWVSENDADE